MIPKFMTGRQETLKLIGKGLLLVAFCCATVLVFICFTAIIITKTDFSYQALMPITTGILALSSFLDSFILSKKIKENGFAIGLIVASIITIIMLIYSFIFGGFKFSSILLTKLMAIFISGVLGGIIGVNTN